MTPSQTASPASPPGNSLFPGSLPPSFKSCLSLCVWFTDLIRIVAPSWVGGYLTRHRECFSDYNTSVTPSDILENTPQKQSHANGSQCRKRCGTCAVFQLIFPCLYWVIVSVTRRKCLLYLPDMCTVPTHSTHMVHSLCSLCVNE